jgi:hypothetical protein
VDFDSLNLLLKASSKDTVVQLCHEAFISRNSTSVPDNVINSAASLLGSEKSQAKQLLVSLRGLVKNAVFQGSAAPADVVKLFPGSFHKNLRDLLGKIIIDNLQEWKSHAVHNNVSLPRLADFDWRVDIKTSSDNMARMSVPTCILQLKVQEAVSEVGSMADLNSVNVELSKETLDTMLDGLGKIRDQLSSVAKKT